jgi:hypothetical protein
VNEGYCRTCGAPILWVRTVNGVPIPLDRDPTSTGNVVLLENLAHVTAGPMEAAMLAGDGPVYMPHHATCPQGRDWKGKKR